MKYLFSFLGFFFFAIGVVGIYLPVLPTVPFLLLSIYCFNKGSDRFRNFVQGTGVYKKHLEPIKNKEGLDKKTKAKVLATVSLLLGISIYLAKNTHLRIFLLAILLGHYYYFLFRIKTRDQEKS